MHAKYALLPSEIRKVAYTWTVSTDSTLRIQFQDKKPCEGMRSILLVDDDVRYRQTLIPFLEAMHGVDEVWSAENGAVAVEMVRTNVCLPDLVLLDLLMPVMPGLQALPLLRETLPTTTGIIILSSHERSGYEEAVVSAGADAYVSKMETAKELPRVMRQVWARRTQL